MKTKIRLYWKIYLFSIFLIIFTITIGQVLGIFFADNYFIKLKKNEIVEISKNVKKLIVDYDILEHYTRELENTQGINVEILKKIEYSVFDLEHSIFDNTKNYDFYENLEDGFQVKKFGKTNISLLIYKEEIFDNKILVITTSLSLFSNYQKELSFLNLSTMVFSLLLSLYISRIFTKKLTKNIEKINEVAQKISNLDFGEKLKINSNDELETLGKSINVMSDSIEKSIKSLKLFVSNASHELKTPLSIINLHTQGLLTQKLSEKEKIKYYKTILKQSNDMTRLIQELLLLTKLNSFEKIEGVEEIELKLLLQKSIEKYEFLELQKDITYDIKLSQFKIMGNFELLKIVIDNLVQNALKYSPEGREITVYSEENRFCIENFTEKKLKKIEELEEPFSRGENSQNIEGYGLGLSIIKSILDLHKIKYSIQVEKDKFIFSLTY